jgi:hypothetical protein
MVVIPSVLNSSDTWTEIDKGSISRLDELQNTMFKNLFAVPHSVPIPALCSELGCQSMEERIDPRKLNFIFNVKKRDNSSVANEIYEHFNFPGLVQVCRKLI